MDIKDVSHIGEYAQYLERIKDMAERALRRKGQMAREHPPPDQVKARFLMNLELSNIQARSQKGVVATSQVPAPYAPCVRSVSELKPMMISTMRLEMHHRGKRIVLRIRTPPQRMTAVMAIVQDEEDTAVLLQLYNQPDESVMPVSEIIRRDSVLIIKEPFFKCATDGSYSLRVDHPSDIIWLEDTDEKIPPKWRKPVHTLANDSKSIRMQGNDAVQSQSWAVAQRLYTSAIQAAVTTEEEQMAYLNRSLANLRLGHLENAMLDAALGSDADLPSEKGLFREARAHYELKNFSLCMERLQMLAESHPENRAVKPEIDRCTARLHEQQSGEYDFPRMYKQAKLTPPLIDCATFSANVEVRQSPGRGRGLFTTKPVSAGQLLLCEKAFAYSYAGDDQPEKSQTILMNLSTNKIIIGGQADLLKQIVQKIYHSPQSSHSFCDLHHGDYATAAVSESDGAPVVDSFLVEKIISLNSFGAPRTSRLWFAREFSDNITTGDRKQTSHTTSGIWLLASRINHSCVTNCRRAFIGDMQIVRATKDLEAGTELLFYYKPASPLDSYEETQKSLSHWGFTCSCNLCTEKKSIPENTLQRRKSLCAKLKIALQSRRGTDTSKVQRLFEQLEETYPETTANAGRMELWDPCFALGDTLLEGGKPEDAIIMITKGFEALGYLITAYPASGGMERPQLEVKQWGRVTEYVPIAFLTLFMAYARLSPELCMIAKKYIEISYCVVVGERDTVCDVFAELA
ncbi:hypothetical protein G7Z17_g3039 [Cylindrodendrum hubeiense]|uniref:SET domain-containing protein n=1 Tax=Cylindrodendrum hubeiense TaxID=595255 RepID=A0A9P5HBN5_9HYPO|nr:hypothetical protein G7Z17_g3039 [Cylindrodendrum hubeiense]